MSGIGCSFIAVVNKDIKTDPPALNLIPAVLDIRHFVRKTVLIEGRPVSESVLVLSNYRTSDTRPDIVLN